MSECGEGEISYGAYGVCMGSVVRVGRLTRLWSAVYGTDSKHKRQTTQRTHTSRPGDRYQLIISSNRSNVKDGGVLYHSKPIHPLHRDVCHGNFQLE